MSWWTDPRYSAYCHGKDVDPRYQNGCDLLKLSESTQQNREDISNNEYNIRANTETLAQLTPLDNSLLSNDCFYESCIQHGVETAEQFYDDCISMEGNVEIDFDLPVERNTLRDKFIPGTNDLTCSKSVARNCNKWGVIAETCSIQKNYAVVFSEEYGLSQDERLKEMGNNDCRGNSCAHEYKKLGITNAETFDAHCINKKPDWVYKNASVNIENETDRICSWNIAPGCKTFTSQDEVCVAK